MRGPTGVKLSAYNFGVKTCSPKKLWHLTRL